MDDDGWAKEREREKRKKAKKTVLIALGIDQFNSITYYACSKLENSHYVGIAASKPNKSNSLRSFFVQLNSHGDGKTTCARFFWFLLNKSKFTVVREFFS